mmetsp:Transcript_27349/g.40377  ORF Transcript_27349/g.40377 Transcript_27349/m.40377 type:complete len:129 (-) Transcript_27349:27-413(-)|eukprot:CAMPEP_0194257870 /NCGR_PEP_ID=MMETSP0158-20130606/40057_1 /TAXON_ID=33649 /ORGANISM="Thalassionema nitzschioides, Strain L26-B" /LENGTH=128 /DNA_ID=CAMNT_0038997055 /DNA_START=76 /DNA_END=462 /DNA_ORIENTATION=-
MAEENIRKIGIKATFSLPDGSSTIHEFDASNTAIPTLGEIQDEGETVGSYGYSGKHDQGELPAPREGGDYAQLIGCVSAMKDFSNQYLTDRIKQEKCRRTSKDDESIQNSNQTLKKSRPEPKGTRNDE